VAKTSLIVKQKRPQKYKVRAYSRCNRCGRGRAVHELAHQGTIPGMTKSSW
jgi:small subunit ribosomal protein S14